MTDKHPTSPESSLANDDVGRLIRHSGAREDVAVERVAKAHARVLAHWENETKGRTQVRTRRRVTWYAAAAAGLLAAISASWVLPPLLQPPAGSFATVVSASGEVYLGDVPLAAGNRIDVSTPVQTLAGGRAVLDMDIGHEVRLDENTRMIAKGTDRFSLERGAVFVRSSDGNDASVFIDTPFGTASDLGTQFIVKLVRRSIIVGVREGLVQLEKSRSDRVNVEDGSLYILSDDGLSQFRRVAADDEIWDWVDAKPPVFDIEGASLASYLAWYAQEIGAELQWADDTSKQDAEEVMLSGSIEGATLKEGFEEVRRMAPFEFEMTNSTLKVRVL
ncbi:MAG: FecR family protein [Woeseiaceae bacterium]|nr:FecR family protein [Woeseiaceae bacterium]